MSPDPKTQIERCRHGAWAFFGLLPPKNRYGA